MKISIITATYNSADFIANCIDSVNSQTYQNIEHIIIDGASTDNTLEIIGRTNNRVNHLISEPDQGIYDALNKGIQLATGSIIGFLHADDKLSSVAILEKIKDSFEDKKVDGVYGNLVFTNSKNEVVRIWQSKSFQRKNLRFGWMPPHPTLFLRKEVYEKHGLFDISYKIAGDYEFMLRIMQDSEVHLKYLSQVITNMRIGGASTGSAKSILLKMKEDVKALRQNGFKYPLVILASKNLRKLPQLIFRYKNL